MELAQHIGVRNKPPFDHLPRRGPLIEHLLGYPPNIPTTGPHEVGHALLLGHQFDHATSLMCSPACPSTTLSFTDQVTLSEVYRWL